jgi:hypothetical protein
MSLSAYGRVIYGYGPQANEYLRVIEGKESVCVSNSSHEIVPGGPYCPRCGDIVEERDRKVLSPQVVEYATRQGVTPEAAFLVLEPYQHRVNLETWVFGIDIVSGSEGACETFRPIDSNEDMDRDMLRVIQGKGVLRDFFGDDLRSARYHLLVHLLRP